MYENIFIPIFIFCVVTLMYCKKEIMKYKNPSIVQQQMKEKIWSEMIMTEQEEKMDKKFLLENPESMEERKKDLIQQLEFIINSIKEDKWNIQEYTVEEENHFKYIDNRPVRIIGKTYNLTIEFMSK
jgi:hypothetical protein